MLGAIRPNRAYYHCKACRKGHCPGDHDLGLTAGASPGATQAVCIAGVVGSFAVAAEDVLPRLAGPELSESTVQRTTKAVGRHVEGLLD